MKSGKHNEFLFSDQPLIWFTMNLYSAWFTLKFYHYFSAKCRQLSNDLYSCKHRGKKIIIFSHVCFPYQHDQASKTNLMTCYNIRSTLFNQKHWVSIPVTRELEVSVQAQLLMSLKTLNGILGRIDSPYLYSPKSWDGELISLAAIHKENKMWASFFISQDLTFFSTVTVNTELHSLETESFNKNWYKRSAQNWNIFCSWKQKTSKINTIFTVFSW